jgi:hypothetical protein
MSFKFLAQGNNRWPLKGFEPMRLAIIKLLVQRINHSAMPPLYIFLLTFSSKDLSSFGGGIHLSLFFFCLPLFLCLNFLLSLSLLFCSPFVTLGTALGSDVFAEDFFIGTAT